ncbi:MAG: hypothetical protein ABS939_24680, partial [Psychrobacillus sp.]
QECFCKKRYKIEVAPLLNGADYLISHTTEDSRLKVFGYKNDLNKKYMSNNEFTKTFYGAIYRRFSF